MVSDNAACALNGGTSKSNVLVRLICVTIMSVTPMIKSGQHDSGRLVDKVAPPALLAEKVGKRRADGSQLGYLDVEHETFGSNEVNFVCVDGGLSSVAPSKRLP